MARQSQLYTHLSRPLRTSHGRKGAATREFSPLTKAQAHSCSEGSDGKRQLLQEKPLKGANLLVEEEAF